MVTDLDGTLWGPDVKLPAAHAAAMLELIQGAVPLVMATARDPASAARALGQNGIRGIATICTDGAIGIEADGTRFVDSPFSSASALRVLELFEAHDLDPCLGVFGSTVEQVISRSPATCLEHMERLRGSATIGDLSAVAASVPIYCMSITGRPWSVLAPTAEILRQARACELSFVPDRRYGGWTVRATPRGVDKWTAAQVYLTRHGIDASATLSVGDGVNDVPLLRASALAVGVRGGHPDVVAQATVLIDGVDRQGWSRVPTLARMVPPASVTWKG